MSRLLILLGIALALIGIAWPIIGKLPFGHLPGDIIILGARASPFTCLLARV